VNPEFETLSVRGLTSLRDGLTVAGASTSAGAVNITNATASTSTTTGALRVTGGVGIGGAVRATDGFIGTPIQRVTGFSGLLDDIGFVAVTGTIARASQTVPYRPAYCPVNDRLYMGGASGVAVVNPATNTVETTITSVQSARILAYCPTNNCMYCTVLATPGVCYVISCATNSLVASVTVGNNPYGIAYCPVNNTMYVVAFSSNNVTPIACSTNTAGSAISVGSGAEQIAYCPRNNTMYVSNRNDDDISPIDCATDTKGTDLTSADIDLPLDLAYCPDNNTMYVVSYNENKVVPLDCGTGTFGTAISVASGPYGICFNPRNRMMYVARVLGTNGMSIITTGDNGLQQEFALENAPQFSGFCPSNQRVYVPRTSVGITILT
jgi:YVTN family beta-propeller protein